jgi:hypothetical protein
MKADALRRSTNSDEWGAIMKWISALPCGLLVICACLDPTGTQSYQSSERRAEAWVGRYANALDTVVVDGTPTSVHAFLDLYRSPTCQFYAKFSTEEPDNWAVFHGNSCTYYVERGAVTLTMNMRVHYPGGNDLVDASTTFEPVDDYWTAVVWTNLGIRLEREVHSNS